MLMNMHKTVMCNTYRGLLLTNTLCLSPSLALLDAQKGSQLTHTLTHIDGVMRRVFNRLLAHKHTLLGG